MTPAMPEREIEFDDINFGDTVTIRRCLGAFTETITGTVYAKHILDDDCFCGKQVKCILMFGDPDQVEPILSEWYPIWENISNSPCERVPDDEWHITLHIPSEEAE